MSIRIDRRIAALAILGMLSVFAVVTGGAPPAAAQTRTWTGLVDCYGTVKSTGLTLNAGDTVQVRATGLCYFYAGRPSNRTPGEGLHSRVGSRDFTYGAPTSGTAPVAGGLTFYFGDSGYGDNFGDGYTVTVTVTSAAPTSRPPTGAVTGCTMRAKGAECTGWAEDPDRPTALLTVEFRVRASAVYPAHTITGTNGSTGNSAIKPGNRWFSKVPIKDVYNGTDIEIVVLGVNAAGTKDGVNKSLGVKRIGTGSISGAFTKSHLTAATGTKTTVKTTFGNRYDCTSTTSPRRAVPAREWNSPLAGTGWYTKRQRWCINVAQNNVLIGRMIAEFNVQFEVALWTAPFNRRVLVNSNNVVYWSAGNVAGPRPDNIDAQMQIFAPGIALTLEAGPASLSVQNGRLTGDFGTGTQNESQIAAATRGTIITYAGVATPTLQLNTTGRFGSDYFIFTSSVSAVTT